jgi:hypothetical protein
MFATCPTSNSPLQPVHSASLQCLFTSLQRLIQTRIAYFKETVRRFDDIIPEKLVKDGVESNEISSVMVL